jgi:poly-gamma-glutamate capsule biosynthesis protein CapA/YwtB (metallophosphatase superfamily)
MKNENSVLLAGDMIITRKWSSIKDNNFLQLIKLIQESDVSVANLETLIHSFKGFPENCDQGTPMASNPEIAEEIARSGFNLLAGANNHANDYGVIGTLENMDYVTKAGLKIAGVGRDLQEARKPVFYENHLKYAFISAVSTFDSWAKANNSTTEVAGRPGVNPVSVTAHFTLFYKIAKWVYQIFMKRGIILKSPGKLNLKLKNKNISVGKEFSGSFKPDKEDILEILEVVKAARKDADIIIFSMHSHEGPRSMPPEFLRQLACQSIDAGVDIFFSHGPHYIKGIEIYKNRPIFYSLGNFAFETETIDKLPSIYYDKWEVDYSLNAESVHRIADNEFNKIQTYWESFVPVIKIRNKIIYEILLYPISLGFGKSFGNKGTPYLADKITGKRILSRVSELSIPFKTVIEYDELTNTSTIHL